MNLQFYIEKLEHSEVFKKFIKDNSKAFLCSGFFVIDKEGKEDDKIHLDYFVPENSRSQVREIDDSQQASRSCSLKKVDKGIKDSTVGVEQDTGLELSKSKSSTVNCGKMFSFQVHGEEIKKVDVDMIDKNYVPIELLESRMDFKEVEEMIEGEMLKKEVKSKIQKMIIVLQNKDGKNYFLCTVFISGLGLLRVFIDEKAKKITLFEKKSFFDIMKVTGKK